MGLNVQRDLPELLTRANDFWPDLNLEDWELVAGKETYRQLGEVYSNRDRIPTTYGLVNCRLDEDAAPTSFIFTKRFWNEGGQPHLVRVWS